MKVNYEKITLMKVSKIPITSSRTDIDVHEFKYLETGTVGTYGHIFVLSRYLCVLKWGLLFEGRRGLIVFLALSKYATIHSSSHIYIHTYMNE